MIQVRLKVPVRRIRTDNGTEFVNQTLREYYEQVGISYETFVARSPWRNDIVERCNRMLIEAARTMSIYAKALLFLWANPVATACYTQNRSIIRLCHGKTPYELLHDKLPDLYVDHPAPEVVALIGEVVAPESAELTGSPSSTTVDQDAPLPSNFLTKPDTQSPIISNDVEDDNHDLDVAYMSNDSFFGLPIPEEREAAFAKPHHMIASSNSRISSKNMPRFSSNDMVHNHYLEEAKKKTQEHNRNSEPSLMPSARSQSIANGSKPKPRSNTQTSRN
nr:putative ribonuclease H-like domain-containing protein [Tanacetum cinerariifolium]